MESRRIRPKRGDLRVRRPGTVPGTPSAPGRIVIEKPQAGWPWVGKGPAPIGYDGGRDAYHSRVCLKVTKASLRRQRVDFSKQMLMAVLRPDAFLLTVANGRAHVLKHDRRLSSSVPLLVWGWQNACSSTLSCRLRQAGVRGPSAFTWFIRLRSNSKS